MTAEAFLTLITQIIFLLVAGSTLLDWLRQRNQTRLDIALVFLAQAVAIIAQDLQARVPALGLLVFVAFVAQPYLLLRVARYFATVPRRMQWAATVSLIVVAGSLVLIGLVPILVFILFIAYFLFFEGYASYLFLKGAKTVGGITAKRLRLVAVGSALLSLVFVIALGVALLVVLMVVVTPQASPVLYSFLQSLAANIRTAITPYLNSFLQVLAIGSGLSYYFGFVPPRLLRQAWQFEELRHFLQKTTGQVVNDPDAALSQLAEAARHTVGGVAAVARCDSTGQHLALDIPGEPDQHYTQLEAEGGAVAEAWQSRQPRQAHPPRDVGPQIAQWVTPLNARTLFVVPIQSEQRAWGILLLALPYAPLFAADDLELLNLLVSQSAAAIDHTALIEDLRVLNQSLEQKVTERAEALRETEKLYRNLVDNALVGVFRSRTNGEILYLNQKSLETFGYDNVEDFIYEKALTHYRNPADRLRMVERLEADGQVSALEVEMMTRKGEPRTFLLSATLTGDVLEGMTVDITERKQAEKLILQMADRAQAVAEVSRALTSAKLDYEGVLQAAAQRTAELVGDACVIRLLSADGLWLNPVAAHHTDPSQLELLVEMFGKAPMEASSGLPSRVVQSGRPILLPHVTEDQLKLVTKPEYWPYLAQMGLNSVMIAPLYEGDRIIGTLSLSRHNMVRPYTAEDESLLIELADRIMLALINARLYGDVQHELAERKQSQEALRQSEERFSKAFRASPAAVTITRLADGTFVEVNEVFLNLTGYRAEEIIGRRSTDLNLFTNADERAELARRLQQDGSVRNYEMAMKTRSGTLVSVLFSTEMIELNNETHILALLFDITKRKEAEAQLQKTMQKLEINNRELQDFAYVASHDLQEPLRKIQAFGDRLKKQTASQLDEKSRDYLERMQSAAARMQALINDLLTFSRVTTKAQPFEPTNLSEVVSDVLSDLEISLERSGGRVEVGPLPTLEADASQMRQVMQNLIGNALKFHKPEVPPMVSVSGELKAGYYELRVADNGIGFDEKYLDRIFTPFQRLHGRGEFEGTGIGLSVVRKIVDRHGGKVTAQSQPDAGSTFILTLPIKHVTEIA